MPSDLIQTITKCFCVQKSSDKSPVAASRSIHLNFDQGNITIIVEKISPNDIDFDYFCKPLRKYFDKEVDRSKGGRPGYDYVLMFKISILQWYYNLSDDSIEYAILDPLSFMRFLGLGINDPVPVFN